MYNNNIPPAYRYHQAASSAPTQNHTVSLPFGWSEHFTPEGKKFYFNAYTKNTQWHPPSVASASAPAAQLPSPASLQRHAPTWLPAAHTTSQNLQVTATSSASAVQMVRFLQSKADRIRMDARLSNLVRIPISKENCSVKWINPENRDLAIDNFENGLKSWNPGFIPKTESDGEDDETISKIASNDATHRLQRTYDIANLMRNEDSEAAYFASFQLGPHVLGLMSVEPGSPPYIADLVTHPGSSHVGQNLLRLASEYSRKIGEGGAFQLDAGDKSALVRYERMGLKKVGEPFLMRFEDTSTR